VGSGFVVVAQPRLSHDGKEDLQVVGTASTVFGRHRSDRNCRYSTNGGTPRLTSGPPAGPTSNQTRADGGHTGPSLLMGCRVLPGRMSTKITCLSPRPFVVVRFRLLRPAVITISQSSRRSRQKMTASGSIALGGTLPLKGRAPKRSTARPVSDALPTRGLARPQNLHGMC
jgi:hypothetical protein